MVPATNRHQPDGTGTILMVLLIRAGADHSPDGGGSGADGPVDHPPDGLMDGSKQPNNQAKHNKTC
jgi:hypothetical protein